MLRPQPSVVEQALLAGLAHVHKLAELFESRPCTSVSAHNVVDALASLHVPAVTATPSSWNIRLYSFANLVAELGAG
jgi:hypothetical protein